MSFELAQLQIEAGMPLENIRDSVEKAYKTEDKETFDKAMREEYDALFPTYRPMIESEWSSDTDLLWSDLTAEDRAELVVVIDYSEDETYKTFEEYMNETRVVTEAVYEDEFVDDINVGRKLVSPEITEFVRPYVANDVTDKVDVYMLTLETAQSKEEAQTYLNSTDWYVARYGETGVAIPDDIKAKRAEARLIL